MRDPIVRQTSNTSGNHHKTGEMIVVGDSIETGVKTRAADLITGVPIAGHGDMDFSIAGNEGDLRMVVGIISMNLHHTITKVMMRIDGIREVRNIIIRGKNEK